MNKRVLLKAGLSAAVVSAPPVGALAQGADEPGDFYTEANSLIATPNPIVKVSSV